MSFDDSEHDWALDVRRCDATLPEVMIAYQMNGEQLPLLNGFPLRLIVPG